MSEPSTEAIARKVSRRLLPTLFVMYVISFIDRSNLALVKTHLAVDVGIDAAAYGLGAGLFFVGYALLGLPSNLALHRFGARRWLSALMIVWGPVSCAMALVDSPGTFYLLRILLGAAEAGFYPGVILYITYWFPERIRGRSIGRFQSAVAVSSIIGNPLGSYLLGLNGLAGLKGWQWMFILEGVPAVIVGVAVLWLLTDRPESATWLSHDERTRLAAELRADEPTPSPDSPQRAISVLRDTRVLRLMFIYLVIQVGVYGVTFWLPTLVRRINGLTDLSTGFVSAIPWVFALIGVLFLPWWSDRAGNRRGPLALALTLTAAGLVGAVLLPPIPAVACLCVSAFGFQGAQPIFWTIPPTILSGARIAGTIGLIATVANFGGFLGPYIMGLAETATGSSVAGLFVIAAIIAPGIAVALSLSGLRRRLPARDSADPSDMDASSISTAAGSEARSPEHRPPGGTGDRPA
jgi:MFS transporter, ACS family, tartrate transporter